MLKHICRISLACALIALPLPAAPALGGLTTAGPVWSNQVALPSGSTVYAGDLIETGKEGLAVLSSPALGRIEIRAESKASLADGAVVLNAGVVAANQTAVRVAEFEVSAQDKAGDNWFVVSEQNGERLIAAYRGDVLVRGGAGSFVVPEGSFAMAAAVAPPVPKDGNQPAATEEDDDDDEKAAVVLPRKRGRAAGAGSKSGWSIGSLGTKASVALVTAGTAAAITGAATTLTNDPASPND